MAQRDNFGKVSSSPRIYTAMDDQAFQRIHLDSSSQLNWYVNFARQDLKALLPDALIQLQHDITSIQRAFYGHLSRRYLSSDELAKTQSAVASHLKELVETGETYFPNFLVDGWVSRRDVLSQCGQSEAHNRILEYLKEAEGHPTDVLPSIPVISDPRHVRSRIGLRYLVPDPEQAFLFHLARLLGEFGDRLKACQRRECTKIFLQERTTARFCSRQCQSVSSSAQYRARGKKVITRKPRASNGKKRPR